MPCITHWEEFTGHVGQRPLLKLILLFQPCCTDHVVFSVVTPIPRCSRSVQTSTPGDRQEMPLPQHMSFRYFMYVIFPNPQNIPVRDRTRIWIHRNLIPTSSVAVKSPFGMGACLMLCHPSVHSFPFPAPFPKNLLPEAQIVKKSLVASLTYAGFSHTCWLLLFLRSLRISSSFLKYQLYHVIVPTKKPSLDPLTVYPINSHSRAWHL